MPTPAPQPLTPAQFEPQSGAITIANIVAMAIPLACTRAILCVSFSICDPNESTLRQGTTDVNAMCATVVIQAQLVIRICAICAARRSKTGHYEANTQEQQRRHSLPIRRKGMGQPLFDLKYSPLDYLLA